MKSNKKIIIMAVIIGLITVFALNYYLSTATEHPAVARETEQTSVVVAETTIPQHTRITSEMVRTENVFVDAVHPETLQNIEDAVGGISRSEIVMGEQVLSSRVATEEMRASLSYRVPENMRAISIPVQEISGVSGFISPGDRVDVLVTYSLFPEGQTPEDEEDDEEGIADAVTTYTTVQNIPVLAAGGLTHEQDDEEQNVVSTVTLLANPEQAEVLAYATLQGTFHLTLRSPLDEEILDLDYYNVENFETFRER